MAAVMADPPVASLRARTAGLILSGALVLAAAAGGFTWWASTAPISSAAVASGTVGPENSRRAIQHFDGGVVEEIFVRDGQVVEAGELIVRLDDTSARAAIETQALQIRTLEAELERLTAERKVLESRDLSLPFAFSQQLIDKAAGHPEAEATLRLEESRYRSSVSTLRSSIELYRQTLRSYDVQIEGLEAQIASIQKRQSLIQEELNVLEDLEQRGLEVRGRTAEQRVALVEVEQLLSERVASVASMRESIRLTELQIEELWASRLDETIDAISSYSTELQSALATYAAYEATLERTVVSAPVSGTLIELEVNTVGAVIAPGQTIVEIVPSDEALTIQANLDPKDIDVVAPNQMATVSLLAYPQRNLPTLHGRVTSVSADILFDTDTGEDYYLATVVVDQEALEALGEGIALVPGMPVEVRISVASRTFFDYLLEPLLRFRDRALRET